MPSTQRALILLLSRGLQAAPLRACLLANANSLGSGSQPQLFRTLTSFQHSSSPHSNSQYPAPSSLITSSAVRAYATSAERAAVARRLAAATARREKAAEEQKRRSLASQEVPAVVTPVPEAPAAEAAATTAVVPVESKAADVQLEDVVGHQALIITRPIEWGTVILGYEQMNKYTVYDQDGQIVALMAEDYQGIGNELGRQLLRTRRSFTATVFSADGSQVIFRVRRPAYLISSSMYVEDGAGTIIGEIQQRWNLIKRNYDLYINKQQFAAISGSFLAWEFELKDNSGGTLALVDRNFQGFGKEIFTDAGKYVIHFGSTLREQQQAQQEIDQQKEAGQQQQLGQPQQQPVQQPAASTSGGANAAPQSSLPPITTMAMARTDVGVIPTQAGNQLAVARPLQLSERMITLACAIAIDYDYFSQHSRTGGGFFPYPMIYGGGGGGAPPPVEGDPGAPAGAAGAVGAAGDADSAPAGDYGSSGSSGSSSSGFEPQSGPEGVERDLGGDSFPQDDWQQQAGPGDGEMKWDLPGDGGGSSGGEDGGGVGGIIGTLWGIFNGD